MNFLKVVEKCFSDFLRRDTGLSPFLFLKISCLAVAVYTQKSDVSALLHVVSENNGENVKVMVIMTMKY